jgi:hypothetical protein
MLKFHTYTKLKNLYKSPDKIRNILKNLKKDNKWDLLVIFKQRLHSALNL